MKHLGMGFFGGCALFLLIGAGLLLCPAVRAQTDIDREAARTIGVDEPLNMLDKVNKTLTDKLNSIKNFLTQPKDPDSSGDNSADINRQRLVDMGEEGRRKGVEDCVKHRATTFGDQSNRRNCEAVYLLPEDARTRPPEQAGRPDLELARPAERPVPPEQSTQNAAVRELARKASSNWGSDKFFFDRLLAECSEGQLTSSCSRYLQGADEVAATATGLLASPYAAQLLPFEKNSLTALKSPSLAAAIRERRKNLAILDCKQVMGAAVNCAPAETMTEAAAPPDLGALPTRPGTELGNSLAMQGIAGAERREREREAEERFIRLAATPSRELDAECARRAVGLAAVQRKALYEIRCALASQARTQVAEADRQIAAQALADAAAERERQRLAALEAERSARDARELAAAVGQLAGVLAQAGRQSAPPVRAQPAPAPAPRVAQAAPSQGYAAVVPNPYYPTLACVQMGTQRLSNGQIIPCVQNNCGRSIESHTSAGMWTVGAGVCYSGATRTIVLYGACERNDSFDRSRNMCKR